MVPHQYPRRILLVITGLSPQVVTETLYALAVNQTQPFVPTEIHVITTVEGLQRARLTLLSDDPGWFHRLCADYGLPAIEFSEDQIYLLRDDGGNPLQDIRTPEENACVADQISEIVRGFSRDKLAAMHVSIAGGRKTIGFYLGYALSLYGRPQDRLSHVLVTSEYESHPEFFYPTADNHVIFAHGPNGAPMDTAEAMVTLADIPFVRLRDGLPDDLLTGATSFSATIDAAQRLYGPVFLQLDLKMCSVICGEFSITLSPAEMAFYAFIAGRTISNQRPVRWTDENWRDEYLQMYSQIVSPFSGEYERVENALRDDQGKEYFEQRKSRTNKALRNKLGKTSSNLYAIHAFGSRPYTRYGLKINAESIRFVSRNNELSGTTK